MTEVSIENAVRVLELPMEVIYRLSQAQSDSEKRNELGNLKAIVIMQRRKLIKRYSPIPGATIIGATWERVHDIQKMADYIMQLKVLPSPQTILKGK